VRKDVLITGGSGFLGRTLAKKLKSMGLKVVLGSRDHSRNILAERETGCLSVPFDICSRQSVDDVFSEFEPWAVVHAAASKFVDISEKNPMECVDVNVLGSQNILRASIQWGATKLIGVSTDKAAAPDNIYGFSKAIMERMFHLMHGKSDTSLVCCRMGNIAWSTGSVLPIWREVYKRHETIKATNARRFFFSAEDASQVICDAINHSESLSGKVLIPKMGVASVSDLADEWVAAYGGRWLSMDLRPGDKVDEDLISETEFTHASPCVVDERGYFLLDFSARPEDALSEPVTTKNSPALTGEQIRALVLAEP
jgi:UDP-N-acetylglucosamine 4,6-dehydratase/5-epimerase